jgi:hypothetical protein
LFNTKLGGQSALALPSSSSSSHSRLDWQAEFLKKKAPKNPTERETRRTQPIFRIQKTSLTKNSASQFQMFYFILFYFFCETRDFAQK